MTEGNGNAWENWERNTEESHEYADFILKELGSMSNTVSTIYLFIHSIWSFSNGPFHLATEILTKSYL